MKSIVAICGLQGSGKTTHAAKLMELLPNVSSLNIKSSFAPLADCVAEILSDDHNITLTKTAEKQLMLAVSTWGEMHVDEMIWSNIYTRKALYELELRDIDVVLTDDIRTKYNIQALKKLAIGYNVIVVKLNASEEVRKSRCPTWRANGSYTEEGVNLSDLDQFGIKVIEVDTSSKSVDEVSVELVEKIMGAINA